VKIKRYLDKDMRHVLRRVREDQGPDAVILSNRRVAEGIEVIAAIDYDEALVRHAMGVEPDSKEQINTDTLAKFAQDDEQPVRDAKIEIVSAELQQASTSSRSQRPAATRTDFTPSDEPMRQLQTELSSMRGLLETQLSDLVWKDSSQRFPMRAQILRNLARLGIAPDIANIVIDRIGPPDDIKHLWSAPLTTLAQQLPVIDDDLMQQGGTVALIGPTGVGKTTTIAKIAARFAMHHWADDIALVSADAYRIGAREHLSAFANIIGAKVYAAGSDAELAETLTRLEHKKLVLIDTEGRSQRDRDLADRLASYRRNADRVRFYLTLSAATQEAALDETVREFSKVPLHGCIVTKIDEASQLGCVMSALIRNELPLAWLSDGQRVPDDLHNAARKKLWLVNQAVECMEASTPRVDEQLLADDYGRQSFAHAG
jgi:flagellar biosynthesis protein FlhF